MKMKTTERSLLRLTTAAMVAGLLVLAGCGGGSGPVDPGPTAYQAALTAIQGATSATDAQAAYDAVDQKAITGAEDAMLSAALQDRLDALQLMADIAAQKGALSMAASAIDTSDLSDAAAIGAASAAIANLQAALDAADDVSAADKAPYQTTLDNANAAVTTAQGNLDTQGRMAAQRAAIMSAVTTARAAVMKIDDDASDMLVDAADNAMTALQGAIDGAVDLAGDSDVASAEGTHATLAGQLSAAKISRTAKLNADRDATIKAMAAMAAKMHTGIGINPLSRSAASFSGDNLMVSGVTLSKTDAVVGALDGWDGARFTGKGVGASPTMYEAVIYTDLDKPMQDDALTFAKAYEGRIVAETNEMVIDLGADWVKVASASFNQLAGTKEFDLESPNHVRVVITGTFDGVDGTYYCEPGNNVKCSAKKVKGGFELGGGTWNFLATNLQQKLAPPDPTLDIVYPAYGWWVGTDGDGAYTVTAFTANRGSVELASGINDLEGTATYSGGAAGQYALSSATGGENDSGAFTARATLEANFSDEKVSGTVDRFVGADGKSRDWSVALSKSTVSDTGGINGGEAKGTTVWTIGETAGADSGEWSGGLFENDSVSKVPQVATGTFHSTHGAGARMVGAFGAKAE